MKLSKITVLVVALLTAVLLVRSSGWAGCGCDHPAPCPAPVLPAFGSPGDLLVLTGSNFSTRGSGNSVIFTSGANSVLVSKRLTSDPTRLKVNVPGDVRWEASCIGPMSIEVRTNAGVAASYSSDFFALLARPLPLREAEGHFVFRNYPMAVDATGVLNVPIDISQIAAATNFAVYVKNLPLEFNQDGVIIYNKQGYNLNLFTLAVSGTEKQWGSWYGAKVLKSVSPYDSTILTYWRHNMYEYRAAHAVGGSHYPLKELADGSVLHPDGTAHVDHDQLNVAISGSLRDPVDPTNTRKIQPLRPGIVWAEIHVMQLLTENPDAFVSPTPLQKRALSQETLVSHPYEAYAPRTLSTSVTSTR